MTPNKTMKESSIKYRFCVNNKRLFKNLERLQAKREDEYGDRPSKTALIIEAMKKAGMWKKLKKKNSEIEEEEEEEF